MSISAILLFILILLVLVVVHEFGHFIAAKSVNMRVDEFAFGFPPRLFAKKKGETTYAFNAIPLGGYVSILGENGDEEHQKQTGATNNPRAFSNRPWWAQLLVLIAGVTMNMLLALFIFIVISYGDTKISTSDPVYGNRATNTSIMIVDAMKDSPAFKAGIIPGSTLVSITSGGSKANLDNASSVISFIQKHTETPFTVTYIAPDGAKKVATVAAVYGIIKDRKALGVEVDEIGIVKTSFLESITLGYERTVSVTEQTFYGILGVFSSAVSGEKNVLESLSGPVGIAKAVGDQSEYGYTAILTLVAVLSINLAIINILPLPALDGGRIVVVLIETVVRKKIPFKYYAWVNVVGFSLLILLLVFVTVNDVKNIFH